jgi:hypothetical protein
VVAAVAGVERASAPRAPGPVAQSSQAKVTHAITVESEGPHRELRYLAGAQPRGQRLSGSQCEPTPRPMTCSGRRRLSRKARVLTKRIAAQLGPAGTAGSCADYSPRHGNRQSRLRSLGEGGRASRCRHLHPDERA